MKMMNYQKTKNEKDTNKTQIEKEKIKPVEIDEEYFKWYHKHNHAS